MGMLLFFFFIIFIFSQFFHRKYPSKTDGAVYNALIYSGCVIEKEKYPNVYLWKHNVSQFTEEQRKR